MPRALARTLAALALVAAAAPLHAQELPPARQLVDRYLQAIGAPAALAAHTSVRMTGELEFTAMGLKGTTQTSVASPNKMVSTVDLAGVGQIRNGFDGTTGWQLSPIQGPSVFQGAQLEQTRENATWAEMLVDIAEPATYTSLETVRRTEMGGRPCHEVKAVRASGREAFYCFDVETGLLVGSRQKQAGEMGEVEVIATSSDYKDFGGLKLATRSVVLFAGQEMRTTLTAVEFDTVQPSAFELPPEIRALQPPAPRN